MWTLSQSNKYINLEVIKPTLNDLDGSDFLIFLSYYFCSVSDSSCVDMLQNVLLVRASQTCKEKGNAVINNNLWGWGVSLSCCKA